MFVARAPYRLSLFGGGTDYPAFYAQNASIVIAASISRHCYITLRELPPFFESHRTRLVYSQIEAVKKNSDLDHPSARACLSELGIENGLEIHYDGDMPARSGIGSSSAFTVALLAALSAYLGKSLSGLELAKEAIRIEQEVIGEPVGVQDQIMCSLGGVKVISCGPNKELGVRPLNVRNSYLEELQQWLLVGYFGAPRLSREHAAPLVAGIRDGRHSEVLRATSELAKRALGVLEAERPIGDLGELLMEGWRLKQILTGENDSATSVTRVLDGAIRYGALGGKLMGAGGSGFFLFLAPPNKHADIRANIPDIRYWTNVQFASRGAQVWNLSQPNESLSQLS